MGVFVRGCVCQKFWNGSGNSRRLDLLLLGVPFAWRRWVCCVLALLEGWWLENLLPCLLPFSTMFLDSPIYFIPAGHLKVHLAYVSLAHHVVWSKRGVAVKMSDIFLAFWTGVDHRGCCPQLYSTRFNHWKETRMKEMHADEVKGLWQVHIHCNLTKTTTLNSCVHFSHSYEIFPQNQIWHWHFISFIS